VLQHVPDLPAEDTGEVRLKGIADPVRLWRLAAR
jgi:class 3 adenylate cyclase